MKFVPIEETQRKWNFVPLDDATKEQEPTPEELAAASRPYTGSKIATQLAKVSDKLKDNSDAQRSVMNVKNIPTKAPESFVLDQKFIAQVQSQFDAMPPEQRAVALQNLAQRPDLYGEAAKIVKNRYAEFDQAPETLKKAVDFRVENQVSKFTDQGLRPEYAANYAQIQALAGQPTQNFQQMTPDVIGEQVAIAREEQAKKLQDAGFAERVGAGVLSQYQTSGLGLAEAAADLFGNQAASANLRGESRIEAAKAAAIPKSDLTGVQSLQSAMTSLAGQAPFIAMSAITGTAIPVLVQAAVQQFGQSYAEGKQAGLEPGRAALRAVPMAAAEVFFERFGMTKALSGLKDHVAKNGMDSIPAYMAKAIATEIPAELATTATQYGLDVIPGLGIKKNASLVDLFKELEETLRQTVFQAGATAGITTGGAKAYQAARELPYRTPEQKFGRALEMDIENRGFNPDALEQIAIDRLRTTNAISPELTRKPQGAPPVVQPEVQAPVQAAEQPLVQPTAAPDVSLESAKQDPNLVQADEFEKPNLSVTPVTLKEDSALPEFLTQEDKLKYYFANNKNVKQEDIVTFDDAILFKQPDGSYADVPDASKQDADITYSSIDEIKDSIENNFSGTAFNDYLLKPEIFFALSGGKPPLKEERSVTGFVERGKAAMDSFESAVTEQFGLTIEQARAALGKLIAEKIVKIDPLTGSFDLKDGRFWNKEVMLRAAGVKPEEVAEEKTGPQAAPILQNRNRSNDASITQMRGIAADPDYGRLGFSRDFANGAPVISGGNILSEQLGKKDIAVATDGRRIPIQYAVVDADSILASNSVDGSVNKDYGDLSIKAPRAIAGNGRIAGLQEAHRNGRADKYKSEISQDDLHGISPDAIAKIANPVLVRIMPESEVTSNIGDVSNISSNLELSPVEQAKNDINRVDLDSLEFDDNGEITPNAIRKFIQSMPTTELGKLTDKGIPTRQAYDRLEAAIFAKAYNNDKLISLFSQAKDAEGKLIISALAQVAPQMARLDGAGSLDIRDIVTDGVIAILNAKSRGLTLQQAASQMDIEMSPDSKIIINLFAANARSNKAAVKALREAANFAYQEAFKPTEDMFGAIQKSSREDVLEKLRSGDEKPSTENVAATKGAGTVAANAEGSAAEPGAAPVSGETEENRSGSSLELKGETEAEIRAKETKAKEAAAKAKSEAEKADADRKAEAERKEIAERSKTAKFDLTPTDQVDKDKQEAIDNKAAEDELAGQKDIFGGEEDVSPEYKLASEKARLSSQEFNAATQAFRAKEIDVAEFFAASKRFDEAKTEYDKAVEKEQKRRTKDKPDDLSPAFSALTTLTNFLSPKKPATSTPAGESTETMAMPGGNIARLGSMFGSKLYGKPDNIAAVSVKELVQNSFDAIKEALETKQITQGSIQIRIDQNNRTITVTDNGPGMPGSVMGKEFLELAGTVKGTNRPSGGLGVAKMLFVYENEKMEVVSLRDGVVSRLETTGVELKAALAANPASLLEQMKPFLSPDQLELMIPMIQESVKRLEASGVVIPKITVQRNTDKATVDLYTNLFPAGHGTSVKVTVPKSYIDQSDGKTITIPFSTYTLKKLTVLNKSPLFDNIEVSVTDESRTNVLPIGKDFPIDKYTSFANVKFNWGVARIYVTKDKTPNAWPNTHILSNGLWQFDEDITDSPSGGASIQREFYIDVVPNKNVRPEDPGYPFELNRQKFAPAIAPDFSAIFRYISTIYKQIDFSGEVKSFGTVQYINDDGTLTAPKKLTPTAPPKENAFTLIAPGDTVEVRDGAIFINNRQVPELTQEQIKNASIDYAQLTIPQNEIDPNKVMVHDNTVSKAGLFTGKDAEEKTFFVLDKLVNKYPDLYELTLIPNAVNPDVKEYTFSSKDNNFLSTEGLPSDIFQGLQTRVRFNTVRKNLAQFLPPGRSLSDAARAEFGGRYDNYLSTIGKVFYNLRRGLVDIDPTKYAGLDNEAIGVSIDKEYYGVSIKIPFSGMFINPASTELRDTPAQIASSLLTTMIHELAHFKVRSHKSDADGAGFASEMQRILVLLRTDKQGGGFLKVEEDLTNFINANLDIFNYLNKEFQSGSYIPSGDVFKDASANKTADEGGSVPSKSAGDAGGGRGIRESSGERIDIAGQELQRSAIDTKTTGAEQVGFDFNEESDLTDKIAAVDPVTSEALHKADQPPTASKKLIAGRSPELTAAASLVKAGQMTAAEYDKLVNKYKPIYVYTAPLVPATMGQMVEFLASNKRDKINPSIPEGTAVGLRLDIPAYKNGKGAYVVTIHSSGTKSGPGTALGYASVASVVNATFGLGNQKAALKIASGEAKDALQTIEGAYRKITPEQATERMKAALTNPAWTQIGTDPTRHSYFYDRRSTMPVIAAEEVLQIGNMVLGKNVTYGSKDTFLYSIEPRIRTKQQSTELNREMRSEKLETYRQLRQQLAAAQKKMRDYGGALETQKLSNILNDFAGEIKSQLGMLSDPSTTPENFLNQARKSFDGDPPFKEEHLSAAVFSVIQAAYQKTPWLLNGLRLSVKKSDSTTRGASAGFLPFARVVGLWTGTSGVTDPKSVRHELAHSMEQMMTPDQRRLIVDEWLKSLDNQIKNNKDPLAQKYFAKVLAYIESPSERTQKEATDALPSYALYQYLTPSEYWAVNAESLLDKQLGGKWAKFVKAIARLFEGLKNVFGFNNKYAVHKVFNDILNGDRRRMSKSMLVDFVNNSGYSTKFLNNIQDEEKLIAKHNRPNTPMLDITPVRTAILNGASTAKEVFKATVRDPIGTAGYAVTGLDKALLRARNREIFFGSGLNATDQARYTGELRVAGGLATASVALDNALRGWTIASQVILNGGIKYNTKNLNFTAVKRDKGMAGVYKGEMLLKKRLGNQLGTDIVQGYLEAKRSLSIINEVEARQFQVDALLDELSNMPPGTKPDIVEAKRADYEEAVADLKSIQRVERKVSMSQQAIDEFIDMEKKHPELLDIMENWNAVNQNMLGFWRQVGLLSQSRYDLLSGIKDYVPWNRIMEGDAASSGFASESPTVSSTKSMTNIGMEKLFKAGKPTVQTEFVAKAGQDTFQINPSTVVGATINNVAVNPNDLVASPNGEVKINALVVKGDLVNFTANREIENIIDNMTRSVMRMTINGLRQYAAMRTVSEYATKNDKDEIRFFSKVDKKEGTFNFILNGRNVIVKIKEPIIADAVYGLNTIDAVMLKPLILTANVLRRAITLSGIFQLKQVFKDAPTAALVTGVKRPDLLIGGVYKGFVTSLLRPMINAVGSKITGRNLDIEPVVELLQAAGIGGYQSTSRTPEAEVKLQLGIMNRNVVSFVLKALDHIGDSSDMAQRVAVYKRVLKETGDEAQALYQAANVINFLHRGFGVEAQFLAKTVPFMGAYANATNVLVQALAGGGLKGMSRSKAIGRLALTGGLLMGTTLLYCMLTGASEDYEEYDDQFKMRNYIIPGTKIYLTMNTQAGLLFKGMAEILYNHFIRSSTETPHDATRLRTALREAAIDMLLGPEPLPPIVKTLVEIKFNINFFTGRGVVPANLENMYAAEQYTAATSEGGKILSSFTGNEKSRLLNPIEADHLIQGLFGTAGSLAMWLSNQIGEAALTRPATPANKVPVIGAFTLPAVGRKNEDLFYDLKERVDMEYKTYQTRLDRMKGDEIAKYKDQQKRLIVLHDYVTKSAHDLGEMEKLIRLVGSGVDIGQTPKEKRETIENLQRAKSKILTKVELFRQAAGL